MQRATAAATSNNKKNKESVKRSQKSKAAAASPSSYRKESVETPMSTTCSSNGSTDVDFAMQRRHTERKMLEDDVRLSIRVLLTRHFSHNYSMRLPQEYRRQEARKALETQHAHRIRRIEEKSRNAEKLLGVERNTFGSGVLPIYAVPADTPELTSLGGVKQPSSNVPSGGERPWMRPNPVASVTNDGAADPTAHFEAALMRGGSPQSLQALCTPDLSVYDSANDIRIRSADAVREVEALRNEGVTFEVDDRLPGRMNSPSHISWTPQLQRELADEDENVDESVLVYEQDEDG